MLKLPCKSVVRIGVLVYVVSSEQRVFDSESLRKIVADGQKPESTPVEFTKLPVHTAASVNAQVVDPIRASAERAHAGYVFIGKPHVVGEIAAIYGQKLF